MKKTFTILIAAIAAIMLITQPLKSLGQTRDYYTIAFSYTGSTGANAIGTSTTAATVIASAGRTYVTNTPFSVGSGNCYYGEESTSIRMSKSGKSASLTITLSDAGKKKATSIVVNCKNYNSSNTGTMSANGMTAQDVPSSAGDLTFTFGSATDITSIVLSTTKATYVYSITVNYTSGPTISITDPAAFTATSGNGTLNVTYSGINPGASSSIALYSDSGCETPIVGDCWFTPAFRTTAKGTDYSKIDYTYSENSGTPHDARTVYMKVTLSDGSKSSVTSSKVTISQKRYYTVTFNGNGGATPAPASLTTYTQNVSDGLTAPLTANQFVNGVKAFKNWNTDKDNPAAGTEYADEADYTFSSDITLYAIWAESYSVTYKANGGTGDDIVNNYAEGNDAPIASNTFTAPSGKMFVKWYTKDTDDGTGTAYQPGDEIENIGANYTLYAIWADKCTLTLNSNGMTTTFDVPQGYEYNFPTPSNVPEGYVYKGWSTNSSAAAEGLYSFTPATSAVSYYAVFGEIEYGDFSKVSSEPEDWSGRYLIVAEAGNKAFNGTISSNWGQCSDVTITNNTINKTGSGCAPANGLVIISAGATDDTYKFKFYDNSYMNWTDAKKFSSGETGEDYTISYFSGDVEITSSANNYIQYNSSESKIRSYASDQTAVQLYKQAESISSYITTIASPTISGDIEITTPTTISSSQTFSGDLDITETLTIGGSAVVTVEGDITNSSAANLIIEDGGQLITSSSVQLTYKKNITSAAKDGGWYTISTPVHTASNPFLTPGSVENLILDPATNYDFFYYDEASHTWMNYKQSAFNLNIGQGYLYRNNGAELHFAGYSNQATYYEKALSYASTENKLKGFNLIGNPYPQNITMSDVTVNNEGTLSGGYVLSESGAWSADVAATIAPAQGFLVQIDKTGVTATITKPTGGSKSRANNDYIKFIVANSQHEDAAFALFEEGYGLNKIDHRNSDIPMLYIPKEGHNFAIATMDDNTQSFNLNLKAKTTGKYTLTYKATGNFSYLHVIDRLTGEDVDMLLDGEYSFIASPSDAENRFIVRLEYMNGLDNSEDSIFAYQSGSDIIVNGEGELQIFDVMGRRVATQYVSGVETINLQSHGVYIFKLNEKTQKIVVR